MTITGNLGTTNAVVSYCGGIGFTWSAKPWMLFAGAEHNSIVMKMTLAVCLLVCMRSAPRHQDAGDR